MQKVTGTGVCPGTAFGRIKYIATKKQAAAAKKGDIVCAEHLSSPLVCAASNASGFIISGNEADHTVSYLKECWKPCVLLKNVTQLKEGTKVTIDGMTGDIFMGKKVIQYKHHQPLQYNLKTKIYLHQSIPSMAQKAAKLNTDGVGLLRTNIIIEETGKHPYYYFVKKKKQQELVNILSAGIKKIAQAFAPKPIWVRTMDFSTDELALLEEGENEAKELNPLLGWRGLIRELNQTELLKIEFEAIAKVLKQCKNIGIIFPLVRDISEYRQAKQILKQHGITSHKDIKVGSMFETPSAALQIDEFIKEGTDLAFIGMNDLTQYTLAAERTNDKMTSIYNPINSSVLKLVYNIIEKCHSAGVETTMSYLSPMKAVLPVLLKKGLSSITLQADRINEIGKSVYDAEK